MNRRTITHLNIPSLPLAVEMLRQPELKGRPLAAAASGSSRARITFVSSRARDEGVRRGMPVFLALRNCPRLVITVPDPRLVSRVETAIIERAARYTPVWECGGAGSLYLDLTGTGRLWGAGADAAHKLRKEIASDLGLQGSAAVSGNKMVSFIASRMKGDEGICEVGPGREPSFMAPLPVGLLPGIDTFRERLLVEEFNINLVREIAELGEENLRPLFGASAGVVHRQALGIDNTPVYPSPRNPLICEEETLEEDEHDPERLRPAIYRMTERACMRLRANGLRPAGVSLMVRYSDRTDGKGRAGLPENNGWEFEIYPHVESLFYRVYQRRVRLAFILVSFVRLAPVSSQMSLFDGWRNKKIEVIRAVDSIRERFGFEAVSFGRTMQA